MNHFGLYNTNTISMLVHFKPRKILLKTDHGPVDRPFFLTSRAQTFSWDLWDFDSHLQCIVDSDNIYSYEVKLFCSRRTRRVLCSGVTRTKNVRRILLCIYVWRRRSMAVFRESIVHATRNVFVTYYCDLTGSVTDGLVDDE